MKPHLYIHIFAGISITALAMTILADFWLPMLVGAVTAVLLVRLSR